MLPLRLASAIVSARHRGGKPAPRGVAEDRHVFEALALLQKQLNRRDNLVGHLVVLGVRR